MKRIVTIGGGTGHFSLLRGLKNYDIDLTAIVSVFDNGGSSGELRTEFGILPPGDIRNCLVALSEEAEIRDWVKLFDYRFGSRNFKHNLGNLIITALIDIHGDTGEAIDIAARILRIKGRVLPATLDRAHLYAKTLEGTLLRGEVQVSYPPAGERIAKAWLAPKAYISGRSARAIREADLIVICPGDLYGSIVPNFLIRGMSEVLRESRAKVAYVCNLVTKQGTYGFAVKDFVKDVAGYSGRKPDYVIYNTRKPSDAVVDKYKREKALFVKPDTRGLGGIGKKSGSLLKEYESGGKTVVRHDSDKVARMIMDLG